MAESRRTALKRLFFALGGLIGAGAIGSELTSSRSRPGKTFAVYGSGWRIHSQELARGALPSGGDQMLAYGLLHNEPRGETVGSFYATYVGLHSSNNDGRLASLEQHTFVFPDGTILGSGVTNPGLESDDVFAIIGGTGRFAGARGSYVASQSHHEFGGSGTARFRFTLLTEGAS